MKLVMTAVFLLIAPVFATAADVGKPAARKHAPVAGDVYRYVYAEGWYGSRKLVAPVRRTVSGDEVGLPNGVWLPCLLSCEMTLRKQDLYYWRDLGANSPDAVPPDAPRRDFFYDDHGVRHDYFF